MSPDHPLIGVVVPVFGHSRLVGEALVSVLDQTFDGSIAVVVVVDGDPAPETTLAIRSLARAGERPVYTLFRRNGRLPAARNAGIDLLLKLHPDLDAIYLLDADNRLSPHSLEVFWQSLATHPEAAWAYPEIGLVGLTWGASGIDLRQTAPIYDPLRHLMGNICEAGSMVRGDVFRAGLRFDESFTTGYEDWEFWLQCLDRGMVGTPAKGTGFQYRRRSDSMLAEADRASQDIKAKLLAKHCRVFARESVAQKYCDSCAPYLLAGEDDNWRLVRADGRWFRDGAVSFNDLLASAQRHFHFTYLPRFVLLPVGDHKLLPEVSVERTLALLADAPASLRVGLNVEPVAPESQAPGFDLVALSALKAHPDERLAALAQRLARIDVPVAGPMDRRYGGPASFQVDRFVRDQLAENAVAPAMAIEEPAPVTVADLPARLLIDSADRWSTHPFRPILEARLPGMLRQELDFATLQVNWTRFCGRVFPYYTSPFAIPSRPEAERAEVAMIVADSQALFYAGELKRVARKVAFVTPQVVLETDFAAIEAAEHALSEIFCTAETAARLRSAGVPLRKLVVLGGKTAAGNGGLR